MDLLINGKAVEIIEEFSEYLLVEELDTKLIYLINMIDILPETKTSNVISLKGWKKWPKTKAPKKKPKKLLLP